jgi:hypothetical protein
MVTVQKLAFNYESFIEKQGKWSLGKIIFSQFKSWHSIMKASLRNRENGA